MPQVPAPGAIDPRSFAYLFKVAFDVSQARLFASLMDVISAMPVGGKSPLKTAKKPLKSFMATRGINFKNSSYWSGSYPNPAEFMAQPPSTFIAIDMFLHHHLFLNDLAWLFEDCTCKLVNVAQGTQRNFKP